MVIKRDFQDKFFNLIDSSDIVAILGPRRVGKSTFVEQYFSVRPNLTMCYFNFDQLTTRQEIVKTGIEKLINTQLVAKKEKADKRVAVFIDEVQKEPLVFDQIKIIYDRQKKDKKQKYKFIITGSASLNIQKEISESLAGRVEILRINSFSLSEALKMKDLSIAKNLNIGKIFSPKISFENLQKEKSNWDLSTQLLDNNDSLIKELIEFGSLPEVLEQANIEKKQRYLINYRDTYLEKDIRVSINIGDLKGYSNLLSMLASQCGSLIVKSELKEKAGIAYNTLEKYLSILRSTYILFELEPFIFSAARRIVKSSKAYFFDNGITSLLTGFLNFEQLLSSGLIGTRFENMVISEIIKRINPDLPIADFYFWRTAGGKEVDLVIDLKEKIIPCEIKWTDNPKNIKINSIVSFLNDYKKAQYGVIVYNGDFFMDENNKIIYLPISHFFYY